MKKKLPTEYIYPLFDAMMSAYTKMIAQGWEVVDIKNTFPTMRKEGREITLKYEEE